MSKKPDSPQWGWSTTAVHGPGRTVFRLERRAEPPHLEQGLALPLDDALLGGLRLHAWALRCGSRASRIPSPSRL